MKKETKKKVEKKQVVEIHIYVHQVPPYTMQNPNATGGNPFTPPNPLTNVTC